MSLPKININIPDEYKFNLNPDESIVYHKELDVFPREKVGVNEIIWYRCEHKKKGKIFSLFKHKDQGYIIWKDYDKPNDQFTVTAIKEIELIQCRDDSMFHFYS